MTLTVLQIIPALGTGGAEQACVDMAAALVIRGDRAIVVSSGGWRVGALEKIGATHIKAKVQTKNPAKIIAHAFWLADIIRREKVSLVHARSRAPAWSAKIACAMTGCPFITTFHAAYNFSCRIKKSYNRVMAAADGVIAISDFIGRHVCENYGVPESRVHVINRGIDLSLFDPEQIGADKKETLRRAWGLKKEDRTVILPARLSKIKGQKFLIEAMAKMKAQDVALPQALIIGDDQGRKAYSQELEKMIIQKGLSEHIRLVGACTDMPAAYSVADLVLAPSMVPEGFGRTPVEAMAMGVPVIASALGATMDTIVEGKTGWLLSPDDVSAWAEKIEETLAMDVGARREMAKTSRERVEGHFDLQKMIEKTLTLYDDLVEAREATKQRCVKAKWGEP